MKTKSKSPVKKTHTSLRQSVTIPAQLALEVRRVAKERKVTVSRALVRLAEKGVEAEAAGRARLALAYQGFMAAEGNNKNQAGKELIQAIFGRDATAEDPLR